MCRSTRHCRPPLPPPTPNRGEERPPDSNAAGGVATHESRGMEVRVAGDSELGWVKGTEQPVGHMVDEVLAGTHPLPALSPGSSYQPRWLLLLWQVKGNGANLPLPLLVRSALTNYC